MLLLGLIAGLALPAQAQGVVDDKCRGFSPSFYEFPSYPCHKSFLAGPEPQVWTYKGKTADFIRFGFWVNGKEEIGGDDVGCMVPLRKNGLRVQMRWCTLDEVTIRYVSYKPTRFGFSFEFSKRPKG